MTSAAQKAERCFALARSTSFPGERDTAIARGIAILEKAGLRLDAFDIPGRPRTTRAAPPPPRAPFEPRGRRAPDRYDFSEVQRVMAEFHRKMREAEQAAAACAGESAYDARRRNFAEQCAEAAARDRARAGSGA
jgi:hypothetical protein